MTRRIGLIEGVCPVLRICGLGMSLRTVGWVDFEMLVAWDQLWRELMRQEDSMLAGMLAV